ncbi:Crp/Fnr family transcriptional regulator [Chitinibacteraceae bacterium HSL-7]
MDKAKLLSGSTLFCELEPDELDQLAHHAELRRARARQVIVQQDAPAEEMYAVIRGRLKVTRSSDGGREATLAILEAGEVFGELAMLDGGMRSATVETLEACELLVLRRNVVMHYLEGNPRVMRALISALCQRLRSADDLVHDLMFLNLPERLSKLLRQYAASHGITGDDGSVLIDFKLSQGEMANLVGASRESVNKQLAAWSETSVLALEQGHIRLLAPERLPG